MDAETPHVVTLPRAIVDEMLEHVQASYPDEGCGVLASVNGQIVKNYRVANAAERPDDFSIIGSEDAVDINNDVYDNDWDYFAYYHSHTQTEAYPSPRDIEYAHYWPGSYYIIF
ncbi:MAG TPA: Mov34/MPN/PAD-1 family protein, partial [Ktedonobacterales bacterium]